MRLLNAPLERIFLEKYRALMRELREESNPKPGRKPFDRQEWRARVVREMEPFYRLALQVGGRSMLVMSPTVQRRVRERVGLADNLKAKAKPFVVRMGRTLAERLADTIDTTYSAMEAVLQEAVEDKLDAEEIADLIDEEWDDVLGRRSEMIAITETNVGLQSGREYVAQQTVETWRWITARDERVRPTHVTYGEADAKPVGFNWATLTDGDYTLRYPADPECEEAGETINCRCITVPEDDVEMSPDELEGFLEEFDMKPGDLMGGEDATPRWIDNPFP
jgi:Phage Mu protein F like protein